MCLAHKQIPNSMLHFLALPGWMQTSLERLWRWVLLSTCLASEHEGTPFKETDTSLSPRCMSADHHQLHTQGGQETPTHRRSVTQLCLSEYLLACGGNPCGASQQHYLGPPTRWRDSSSSMPASLPLLRQHESIGVALWRSSLTADPPASQPPS